ncbi:MAG TPA: carboxypeptidase-like regulatory domain-containing protein, partial [Pyrinomonadaceae bacterium]|nr:carboxypeptidase-like regulatory domain-containing protein [Pyrinomonadaceae bacterium]
MTTYGSIVRLFGMAGVSALLLAFFSASATAQTNKAEIVGTVKDAKGAVVQGATVTATKVDTGAERSTTTGDSGEYSFPLLDIGTYRVTANKAGF